MKTPHPIPYQGSKRNLADKILPFIPRDTERFVEPFAGSAALTLALATRFHAMTFVLNDINAPLMGLWREIITRPDHAAHFYSQLWTAQLGRERTFYDAVRLRFNRTGHPIYLLYLLARCVKAAVRYNADGEFNQSPDNRRKGRHPHTMSQDILRAAHLLEGRATLSSLDYTAFLADAQPGDVVYLDPPYQGVSSTRDARYVQGINHDAFIGALETLNKRQMAYLVSYDGRNSRQTYGESLPDSLGLTQLMIPAGRSSQATLLGRADVTIESLYLSPALISRLDVERQNNTPFVQVYDYELA